MKINGEWGKGSGMYAALLAGHTRLTMHRWATCGAGECRWATCEAGDCHKKINENTKLDMDSIGMARERGNIWVKEKTLQMWLTMHIMLSAVTTWKMLQCTVICCSHVVKVKERPGNQVCFLARHKCAWYKQCCKTAYTRYGKELKINTGVITSVILEKTTTACSSVYIRQPGIGISYFTSNTTRKWKRSRLGECEKGFTRSYLLICKVALSKGLVKQVEEVKCTYQLKEPYIAKTTAKSGMLCLLRRKIKYREANIVHDQHLYSGQIWRLRGGQAWKIFFRDHLSNTKLPTLIWKINITGWLKGNWWNAFGWMKM